MGVRDLNIGDTVWVMVDNRPVSGKVNQRTTYELVDLETTTTYTIGGDNFRKGDYYPILKSDAYWTKSALLKSLSKGPK
jgi:hypothetical protein